MRSVKLILVAGLCVVPFFPVAASAAQWVVNCPLNLCLDATTNAPNSEKQIQVSKCDASKTGQQWIADDTRPQYKDKGYIINLWKQQAGGEDDLLDMYVGPANYVQLSKYDASKQAERWTSPSGKKTGVKGLIQNEYVPAGKSQCITAVNPDPSSSIAPVTVVDCTKAVQWKFINVGDNNLCK